MGLNVDGMNVFFRDFFFLGVMRQRNKGCLRGEVAYTPGNLFKAHRQMDLTPPPATSRS